MSHQCLLIDSYTEESDINALLTASESYMIEHQEASEVIEEVRAAIKDWRKTATELQIPIKLLESYSKCDGMNYKKLRILHVFREKCVTLQRN